MRLSVKIVIFLILFNGWAGIIQKYHIDDHLGINAETGNPKKLQEAVDRSQTVKTGNAIGNTLIGMYNSMSSTVESIVKATQPGAKMMIMIVPHGVAEDFITWLFTITPLLAGLDILAYLRGVDI